MSAPRLVRLLLCLSWPIQAFMAVSQSATPSPQVPAPPAMRRPAQIAGLGSPAAGAARPAVNPFRIDRSIGRAAILAAPPATQPAPPRLTGVVWSSPALAIIEGVGPSGQPLVLRVGEERGGARLIRLEPSRAVIWANGARWTVSVAGRDQTR